MNKLFFLLFLLCLQIVSEKSILFAINTECSTRSIYQKISGNNKPDSTVSSYNNKDLLISHGSYRNGKKFHQWYNFTDDLQLKSAGTHNTDGLFSGYKFNHSNNIVQIAYFRKDEPVSLTLDLFRQVTDSLLWDLQNVDFFAESAFDSKSVEFSSISRKISTLSDSLNNESLYIKLLYELSLSKALFTCFSAEKEKILQTYNSLKLKKYAEGFDDFVDRNVIKPLITKTEKILSKGTVYDVLTYYPSLLKEIKEIDRKNALFSPINQQVFYNFAVLKTDIESNIKHFAYIDNELQPKYGQFLECDSFELKVKLGNELIAFMTEAKNSISKFLSYDAQLNNRHAALLALKTQHIPGFQENYLADIEQKKENLQRNEITNEEINSAIKLLEKLDLLIFTVREINAYHSKIQLDLAVVKADYEHNYDRIYEHEINKLSNQVSEINNTGDLDIRLQLSYNFIDSLSYYTDAFLQFQSTDSLIQNSFEYYKNLYYSGYKRIYNRKIEKIESFISDYKEDKRSKEKLDKIYQIKHDVDYIAKSYHQLDTQKIFIEQEFPKIEILYRDSFPKIFRETISEYEDSISDYQRSKYIAERLKLGNQAKNGIRYLNGTYLELSIQRQSMCRNYFKTKRLYKKKFRPIYKTEFSEVTKDMKRYAKEGDISPKQTAGEILLEQTGLMIELFPILAYNDSLIKVRLSKNNHSYRKFYKNIYKAYIKTHNKHFKEYKDIGYVGLKQLKGTDLLDTVLHYFEYSIKLQRQKLDTDKAWKKLENSLSTSDKYVIKKGKKVHKKLFRKQYKNDINIISKFNNGQKLLEFITNLERFYNEGSLYQKSELKKAKSAKEIIEIINRDI